MKLFKEYQANLELLEKSKNEYEEFYAVSCPEMANSDTARTSLVKFQEKLDFIKKVSVSLQDLILQISDNSYSTLADMAKVFPRVAQDTTGEKYRFCKQQIGDKIYYYLCDDVVDLRDCKSASSLYLQGEHIVLLYVSEKNCKGFPLFQASENKMELVSFLDENCPTLASSGIVSFCYDYVDFKEEMPSATLMDFYTIYAASITHGYDETLLEDIKAEPYYHDLDSSKAAKRRQSDRFHKYRRISVLQRQAAKKLEKLPKKYLSEK